MDPERRREEILYGPVWKTLLKLSAPTVVINLVQSMYNIIDAFWLGSLGSSAVSAPIMTWPILAIVFSFGMGIAGSAIAFVSQNRGARKDEDARKSAGQIFLLGAMYLAPTVPILYFTIPYFSSLFGNKMSEVAIQSFVTYSRIVILAIPFGVLAQGSSMIFRAWGYPEMPAKISPPYVVLNAILDPFFIFGIGPFPKLGVAGAALATLLCRIGEGSTYVYFISKRHVKLKVKHLKPDWALMKRMVKVGLPLGIGASATSSGFFILLIIISRVGEPCVVAWGISNRVFSLFSWLVTAINSAASTMIGQAIGNGDLKRAEEVAKKSILFCFAFRFVTSLGMAIFSRPIFSFFLRNPNDPYREASISEGVLSMWIFGMSAPFFAISNSALTPFRASGKTNWVLYVSLLRLWGLRVPLTYALGIALGFGGLGIWTGMAISNAGAAIMSLVLFLKGYWKGKVIRRHKEIKLSKSNS